MDPAAVHQYFSGLQEKIIASLEALDGRAFKRDAWARPEGGGGMSCVLERGNVFERAGVNLSQVRGNALPPSASALRPQLAGQPWQAKSTGLEVSEFKLRPLVKSVLESQQLTLVSQRVLNEYTITAPPASRQRVAV